jgi:hypothetical protein
MKLQFIMKSIPFWEIASIGFMFSRRKAYCSGEIYNQGIVREYAPGNCFDEDVF